MQERAKYKEGDRWMAKTAHTQTQRQHNIHTTESEKQRYRMLWEF